MILKLIFCKKHSEILEAVSVNYIAKTKPVKGDHCLSCDTLATVYRNNRSNGTIILHFT